MTPGPDLGPPTLTSVAIRHNYVKLPVASADLSDLVRLHGSVIEALTSGGAFEGQTFPARSNDGGGSWVIDGPQLNGGGASGPSVTDRLTASSDRTLVAWGRDGSVITTRAPGDSDWRETDVGDIAQVRASGSRLVVRLLDRHYRGRKIAGSVYGSRDDGHSWHRR